jgi:hypothetical protein
MPRIFASGVFGSDYDLWGAWSFTDRRTRDKLAKIISDEDWCLAIGMTSSHTPPHERGRLLALLRIGPEPIQTKQMVEPEHWRRTVETHGPGKWLHGFPIKHVERFEPQPDGLPKRSRVLPRIDAENRYMQVGRYFLELNAEETDRVLALRRLEDRNIYRTPVAEFAARLLKARNGPPPSSKTRLLSAASGPAATYLMSLEGSARDPVIAPIRTGYRECVWKVGFSRDPERRLKELNAYLPSEVTLHWRLIRTQWHQDEINAWALEQRIFALAKERRANRFKGEMLCGSGELLDQLWTEALGSTPRPCGPVEIEVR